jgi:hypothetical protein
VSEVAAVVERLLAAADGATPDELRRALRDVVPAYRTELLATPTEASSEDGVVIPLRK